MVLPSREELLFRSIERMLAFHIRKDEEEFGMSGKMPKGDERFDSLSDHVLGGLPEIPVSRTYSLTFGHINLVKECFRQLSPEARRKFSESRLVRDALEQFAETFDPAAYEALLDTSTGSVTEGAIREHPGFASINSAADAAVSGETVSGRADRSQTGAGFLSGAFRER